MSVSYRTELWHIFHDELDLDGNGHLDVNELTAALSKAGVYLYTSFLLEPHTDCVSGRHFVGAYYADGIYDLSYVFASFSCDKLSRV